MLYGNPMQLGIQAIGIAVAAVLGFGGIMIIMKIINATMGLKVKEEEGDWSWYYTTCWKSICRLKEYMIGIR